MIPEDRWPARRPPADFADRVMAEISVQDRTRKVRRGLFAAVAALVLIGSGAAFSATRSPRLPEGEITAIERTEVEVAPGVRAVVESRGHITWSKGQVHQDSGDVFYRALPGSSLSVRTPRGEVATQTGTCGRIRVSDLGSDGKANVYVAVEEGELRLVRVSLRSGEYARASASGIVTDKDDHDGAIALALAHPRVQAMAEDPTPLPISQPVAASSVLPRLPRTPRPLRAPPPEASASASTTVFPPKPRVPACMCSPITGICDCAP